MPRLPQARRCARPRASPPSARAGWRAVSAVAGLDARRARAAACGAGSANGARRSNSVSALARDEGLDDAVFERVEADHDQASAGAQQLERRAQALFELLKLGVDENPKSLKCARCRVLARLAGLDRTSHDFGKLAWWFEQGSRLRGEQQAPLQSEQQTVLRHSHGSPPQCGARRRGPESPRRSRRGSVSMRMSSGPSKRKLKPRAGSSICGERDAQVEQHAVHLRDAERGEHLGACAAKLACRIEKRGSAMRVSPALAAATACGSLSNAISRPRGDSRSQERARMPAAAEGAVDVDAVAASVTQRVDRFVQQDGGVLPVRAASRPSEAEVLERRRASPTASPAASCAAWRAASHSSKWLPMPSSITSRVRPATARSSGAISTRDEASISTSIALPRKMRFQPLGVHRQRRDACRGTSPTPGAERSSGSLPGAW